LQRYPLVPAAHHQLSNDPQIPNREENQHLLDDALKAQREENQKLALALLTESKRFVESAPGYQVGFSRGEIEWLLQVLNDVRVGSWLALGSPDPDKEIKKRRTKDAAQHALTMDLAAYFEMIFLEAVSGRH
jgi:hypothetical protein